MGTGLILETTFVIDLEREAAREVPAAAHAFLDAHLDDNLYLTFTVVGELACGASLQDRRRWERFIAPFQVLGFTLDVAWQYGNAFRYLQQNGMLIGANDLWIAATAIAQEMPVVTRNAKLFGRVPGLEVRPYA